MPFSTFKHYVVDAGIYATVEDQPTLIAGLRNAKLTVKGEPARGGHKNGIWHTNRHVVLDWAMEAETVYLNVDVDEGPSAGTVFTFAAAERYLRQAAYARELIHVEIRYRSWERSIGDAVVAEMRLAAPQDGVAQGRLKLEGSGVLTVEDFNQVVAASRDWVYDQSRIINRASGTFEIIPDQEYDDQYSGDISGIIRPVGSWPIVINTPIRIDSPETFGVPFSGFVEGHIEDDPAVNYDDRGALTPIIVESPLPIPTPWQKYVRGVVEKSELPSPLELRERVIPIIVESPRPLKFNYYGEVHGYVVQEELPRTSDLTEYMVQKYYYNDLDGTRTYHGQEAVNPDGTFVVTYDISDLSGQGFDKVELRLYDTVTDQFVPDESTLGHKTFWNSWTEGRYYTQYEVRGSIFVDQRYELPAMTRPVMDNGTWLTEGNYTVSGDAEVELHDRDSGNPIGEHWALEKQGKHLSQYRVDFYTRVPGDKDYYQAQADVYTDGTFRAFADETSTPIWVFAMVDDDTAPAPPSNPVFIDNDGQSDYYGSSLVVNTLQPESYQYENIEVEFESWADFIYQGERRPASPYVKWQFYGVNSGVTKVVKAVDTSVEVEEGSVGAGQDVPEEWQKDPGDPFALLGMWSGEGVLPRSYNQTPEHPDGSTNDLYGTRFEFRNYLYDAALALLVATGYQNLAFADKFARGILDCQNTGEWTGRDTDQSFTEGCFVWFTDHWRPINWWQYYGEPVFRRTIDGWCMYALAKYLFVFDTDAAYYSEAQAALRLCNSMMMNYRAPDNSFMEGMTWFGNNFWEGAPDWTFVEDEKHFQGVEATYEVWWGNNLAYHLLGDDDFKTMAEIAANFALNICYDDNADGEGNGWFWTGATNGGPNSPLPEEGIIPETTMDNWSWGGIFLMAHGQEARAQQLRNTLHQWTAVDVDRFGRRYEGYRAHSPWGGYTNPPAKEQVWYEGSFGVALWFYRMGWIEEYETLISKLMHGQYNDGGFLYVVDQDEAYEMMRWPAIGSTAWFPLATTLKDFMWTETPYY